MTTFSKCFTAAFCTCLFPVLLFGFLQTGKQDTKSDQPVGTQWCQSTLAKEERIWALSTVQRATDRPSKNKRRLNGRKGNALSQNLQDWFILGLNYTNWTNETIASLAFGMEVMLLDRLDAVRLLQASIETTLSQATLNKNLQLKSFV